MMLGPRLARAILAAATCFTARQISDATGAKASSVAAELARWSESGRLIRHEASGLEPCIRYEIRSLERIEALARGESGRRGRPRKAVRAAAAEPTRQEIPAGRVVVEDCDFFVAANGSVQFIRHEDGELVHEFTPQGALQLATFLDNVRDHIAAQIAPTADA